MRELTQVKNLMVQPVTTVCTEDLMTEVTKIFEKENFHHLPVVDNEQKLKGIISRHDYHKLLSSMSIFKTESSKREDEQFITTLLVEEVMSEDVVTLRPEDDLIKAIVLLQKNLYHAFPVVNDQQEVIGILTTYDLINYAFKDYNIPKSYEFVF